MAFDVSRIILPCQKNRERYVHLVVLIALCRHEFIFIMKAYLKIFLSMSCAKKGGSAQEHALPLIAIGLAKHDHLRGRGLGWDASGGHCIIDQ